MFYHGIEHYVLMYKYGEFFIVGKNDRNYYHLMSHIQSKGVHDGMSGIWKHNFDTEEQTVFNNISIFYIRLVTSESSRG